MATTDHGALRAREQDFPFTLTRDGESDGQTFSGYAAVFNSPTRIRDEDGEYDEVIAPGAFAKTIRERKPVLMFDHGKHPVVGQMPLGRITTLREDARGLYVEARLSDNWIVQPVRDAIRDQAIEGMSFRFEPKKQVWSGKPSARCRYGDLRTHNEVAMPECGPVVFPAYRDTTASVRSALRALETTMPGVMRIELRDADGVAIDWSGSNDPRAMVDDAIEQLWGLNDFQSDCNIFEMSNGVAVFNVVGAAQSDHPGLYQVTYTYDNETLTLGTPVPVKATGYIPIGDTPPADLAQFDEHLNSEPVAGTTRDTQDLGTSTEAVIDTSEEAATPVHTGPLTAAERRQALRRIQLEQRGVPLSRKAS